MELKTTYLVCKKTIKRNFPVVMGGMEPQLPEGIRIIVECKTLEDCSSHLKQNRFIIPILRKK